MCRKHIVEAGLFVLLVVTLGCTSRSVLYQTGSLNDAKTHFRMPTLPPHTPDIAEQEKKEHDEMDRYRAILEQEYQFEPPVRILLVVPRMVRYFWPDYLGYSTQIDSLNAILYRALSDKLAATEYVDEILWSTSILSFGTLNELRETAAYYRTDEVLLVSYDLGITRPSSCCGFWPSIQLTGSLNSEAMLIDTRTGFFLTGRFYSFSSESLGETGKYRSKELELMRSIVDMWSDAIVNDILNFYEQESD